MIFVKVCINLTQYNEWVGGQEGGCKVPRNLFREAPQKKHGHQSSPQLVISLIDITLLEGTISCQCYPFGVLHT